MGYFVLGAFVFSSIKIAITHELPGVGLETIEVAPAVSLMVSAFILYSAYILWDELIR